MSDRVAAAATHLAPSLVDEQNRTEQSERKGAGGEATQARRGEDEERTPESTDSTDDNEGENKNKAVRQLNERAYARSEAGQRAGQRVS